VGYYFPDSSNPFNITENPLLTDITLNDNLVVTGSAITSINFTDNALNQTTVDRILEVFASGSQSGLELNLDGGTNAAPSATGLVSKGILEGRAWTIYTNPV
jgi:hypothetical protein